MDNIERDLDSLKRNYKKRKEYLERYEAVLLKIFQAVEAESGTTFEELIEQIKELKRRADDNS